DVGTATTNLTGLATLSSVTLVGIDAGTYPTGVTASFAGGGGHGPSVGSNSLTVGKASQTITVTGHAPATAAFGTSFSVSATAPGGPVSSSGPGAGTNTGATFTMTAGTGACSVKYDQPGDTNFNAATQVVESVTAVKASQTITVSTHAPANAAFGTSFGVAAT